MAGLNIHIPYTSGAVDLPNPDNPSEFTDGQSGCPNPYAANGVAFSAGASAVVGRGASTSYLRLGNLVSVDYPHDGNWINGTGYDVGASAGIGFSVVTSVQERKCGC
jgi:hypothetical protein